MKYHVVGMDEAHAAKQLTNAEKDELLLQGTLEAEHRLVEAYLPLATRLINKAMKRLPEETRPGVVSAAFEGLIKGVRGFRRELGAAYLTVWVMKQISGYIKKYGVDPEMKWASRALHTDRPEEIYEETDCSGLSGVEAAQTLVQALDDDHLSVVQLYALSGMTLPQVGAEVGFGVDKVRRLWRESIEILESEGR